jgi:photosystem II stability/assembly factor-like uncharacterized protein
MWRSSQPMKRIVAPMIVVALVMAGCTPAKSLSEAHGTSSRATATTLLLPGLSRRPLSSTATNAPTNAVDACSWLTALNGQLTKIWSVAGLRAMVRRYAAQMVAFADAASAKDRAYVELAKDSKTLALWANLSAVSRAGTKFAEIPIVGDPTGVANAAYLSTLDADCQSPSGATSDPPGYLLNEFIPVSSSTWWALVDANTSLSSYLLETTDSGQSWAPVAVPVSDIAQADVVNAEVAWVRQSVDEGTTNPPEKVFRTEDGGRSWQAAATVPNDCQLDFIDALHGWCYVPGAAAGSESVQLLRTDDGGETWDLVSRTGVEDQGSTPNALPFGCDKGFTFTSPTQGWAYDGCNGGTPLLYATHDGGVDWHALAAIPLPPGASPNGGEYLGAPVSSGSDIAVTLQFGDHAYLIATSHDAGATWSTTLIPGPADDRWSADLIDPLHWELTDGTTLLSSDDGGTTWQSATPSVGLEDHYGYPLTLNFLTPDIGWIIPDGNGGRLSWTTNGGRSWQAVTIQIGAATT